MISPALTSWPPKRFTPSRWALESRPFRLEEAPFLCAISDLLLCLLGPASSSGGGRAHAGDLHQRVLLPVALATPVASLVLVVDHADLGAGGRTHDLGCDLVVTELGPVTDHIAVIHDEQGRQRHGRAHLTGELVHHQDIVQRCLFLLAATANDRVHERTLSPWC